MMPAGIIIYCYPELVQRVPYMTETELLTALSDALKSDMNPEDMSIYVPDEDRANKCFSVCDENGKSRVRAFQLTTENLKTVLGDHIITITPEMVRNAKNA